MDLWAAVLKKLEEEMGWKSFLERRQFGRSESAMQLSAYVQVQLDPVSTSRFSG